MRLQGEVVMQELMEMLLGERFLAFTNFILAFCIVFHICLEFAHYTHEFLSRKKDAKKLNHNNELLQDVLSKIDKLQNGS